MKKVINIIKYLSLPPGLCSSPLESCSQPLFDHRGPYFFHTPSIAQSTSVRITRAGQALADPHAQEKSGGRREREEAEKGPEWTERGFGKSQGFWLKWQRSLSEKVWILA